MGYFHILAIINKASLNICVQVFVCIYVFFSLGYIPQSRIARLYGNSMFNCLRNCQTVFQKWLHHFIFPSYTAGGIKCYRNLERGYFLATKNRGCFKVKEAFNLYFEVFQLAEIGELNEMEGIMRAKAWYLENVEKSMFHLTEHIRGYSIWIELVR